MISVAVDEKACVGCTLCVEACPTQVFGFDDAREVAVVEKAQECFGCLSCAEICPATALRHEGLTRSPCFHHDPYALNLAGRLVTDGPLPFNVMADPKARKQALDDLSVRLLSVAVVLKDIVGTGLAPVGLMAGRSLATQLPRYQPPKDLDGALALAKAEFSPAWDLSFTARGDGGLGIEVGSCAVRELCSLENLPLGGALCVLFYNYLAGYLGRMVKCQMKLAKADRGAQGCSYEVAVLR
ncbi:MAG: 4Fe-4S binding protein [Deltaproteobacteria bacterium]|nr:4Fe-4S binding protein [Deltaproteobacteria bacterium]